MFTFNKTKYIKIQGTHHVTEDGTPTCFAILADDELDANYPKDVYLVPWEHGKPGKNEPTPK